jgi:hypothetical protein
MLKCVAVWLVQSVCLCCTRDEFLGHRYRLCSEQVLESTRGVRSSPVMLRYTVILCRLHELICYLCLILDEYSTLQEDISFGSVS